ncbi:MAG: hypothetical protein VX938_13900, partial [Myxococcota bacterium]|nr:hypothetical protein [Myxococcota bacterium]
WLRVALSSDKDDPSAVGWVRSGRVEQRDDAKSAQWKGLERLQVIEPPLLVLDGDVVSHLKTDDDEISLKGHVDFTSSSNGHRHVYVFVGEEKIFFQPVTEEEASQGSVPFTSTLKLAPGRNQISVVAREGPDDVTRQHIVLFRQESP